MLMYPIDRPVQPILRYQVGQPPFVPNVRLIDRNAYQSLPIFTSLIMNELGGSAFNSPIRMYCYNLYSSNNWNNPEFGELVEFAINLYIVSPRSGVNRPIVEEINEIVSSAISLQVSRRIMENNDLKRLCDPPMLEAASHNMAILSQAVMDIMHKSQDQMNPYPYHAENIRQPTQYIRPDVVYTDDRRTVPVYQSNDIYQSPRYATNVSSSSSFVRGDRGDYVQQDTRDRYSERYSATTITPKETSVSQPNYTVVKEEDWKPTPDKPYKTLVDAMRYEKVYKLIEGVVVEEINEKNDKMNRERHTIKFLGGNYSLDGVVRRSNMMSNVEILDNISAKEVEKTMRSMNEGKAPDTRIVEHVYPGWYVDAFLDAIILNSRVKKKLHQRKKENCNVYRSFAILANPVIADSPDIRSTVRNFPIESFHDLADLLEMLASGKVSFGSDSTDHGEMDYTLKIDSLMTDLVNDFIHHKIGLENLTIDSFMEDIKELGRHLHVEYGSIYSTALKAFEYDVISNFPLTNDYRDISSSETDDKNRSVLDTLSNQLNIDDDDRVNFEYVPVTYSITLIDMFDKELLLNIEPSETYQITEEHYPQLYKIAKSLYEHKRAMKMDTLYDLLVTRDGKIYKLHKSYLAKFEGSYLISL